MLETIKGDTIRGVVFSNYDEFGYQNLYSFPPPIEDLDVHLPIDKSLFKNWQLEKDHFFPPSDIESDSPPTKRFGGLKDIVLFTERDYLQIAVKSISLLIGEKVLEKDPSLLGMQFYGILPYPDLQVYSYTFFRFYSTKHEKVPRACTFSLLIDQSKRNFIYDNHTFLNDLIQTTVNALVAHLEEGEWSPEEKSTEIVKQLQVTVYNFFQKLQPISGLTSSSERTPPFTSHHSKKIVFTGLPNSGKNSFLLTLNRKYSKMITGKVQNTEKPTFDVMGTTILNWETDPDIIMHENLCVNAEIYLDDAHLIYFFVDGSNLNSIENSQKLLTSIIEHLDTTNNRIPILVLISKIDKDIQNTQMIQDNIAFIRSKFTSISALYDFPLHFFETSIFSLSSCLSAFSGGIALLMKNKNITSLLEKFSDNHDKIQILLFNEYGLALTPQKSSKLSNSHFLEIIGSQLIHILKKTESWNISSNLSTISTTLGANRYVLIKKILSPTPFFILLYDTQTFSSDMSLHLDELGREIIHVMGK